MVGLRQSLFFILQMLLPLLLGFPDIAESNGKGKGKGKRSLSVSLYFCLSKCLKGCAEAHYLEWAFWI